MYLNQQISYTSNKLLDLNYFLKKKSKTIHNFIKIHMID